MTNSQPPKDSVDFLTVQDVIDLHSDVIDLLTPGEPKGILDRGRLEAAVLAPQHTFDAEYLYPSIYEMAAVYLHGLATCHAFQQGNKRISLLACGTFLKMNGLKLTFTNDEAVQITLAIIAHELERDKLALLLKEHTEPVLEI